MRQSVPQVIKQAETEIATQSVHSVFSELAASVTSLAGRIAAAYDKREAIARLRQMDDRMLADIGIRRSDIVAAVNGEIYRGR